MSQTNFLTVFLLTLYPLQTNAGCITLFVLTFQQRAMALMMGDKNQADTFKAFEEFKKPQVWVAERYLEGDMDRITTKRYFFSKADAEEFVRQRKALDERYEEPIQWLSWGVFPVDIESSVPPMPANIPAEFDECFDPCQG